MGSFEQKNKIIEMHFDGSSDGSPLRQPSNPQFVTPQSHKQEHKHFLYDQSQFQDLKFMLSDHKVMEAISLFPPSSFIRELILDHHQIAKIHEIMMGEAGTIAFDNIKYDSKILGIQREARLRGLHQLKMTKSLNKTLVNSISNHLQDIILEQFQPLKSSTQNRTQVFIKLYQKLNQIQLKFELIKHKNIQIPNFLRQKAQQVSEQNRNLQQKLTKAQQNVEKYQHQASEMIVQNNILKQSIKQLRLSQKNQEQQKLLLQKKFNQQLQLKQQQFRHELLQLKNKSKVPESIKVMGKELDASIQDFKNLIYKLSLENKLLKEERDLLLAQLARVYEKFQTVVSFYESSTPCDKIQMSPMSAEDEEHHESHKESISQFKQKLSILQIDINNKNQVIQKIKDELDDLRKEKDTVNNSPLERSMSINSGQSNQSKPQGRRYKRTKSGQQAYSKINELQQLRKIDKQLIESLKITVEQLTQKIRANPNAFDQMQTAKRIEPQETSNTITSQTECEQASQQQTNKSSLVLMSRQAQKLKEKIQQLQMSLQEERQTNASLNAILQDLQTFEKPQQDSSVLTPRMLKQISELKDQIQNLKTKCTNLEKSLALAAEEKEQMTKMHQQQVMNLEFQCSQAELSITTLQNKIYEMEVQLTQKDKQQTKNQIKQEDKPADQSLLKQKQQLQQLLDSKMEELKVIHSINQQNKKQIEDLNSKLQSSEKILSFTMAKNKELQKKYKSIVTTKQFRQKYPQQIIHALFNGDILLQKPFEKQFLVEAIQKRTGKTIRRSKMLWKHDSLNKTNLHQYIDNYENFVMLIELEDEYVVGGYSEGKLYPKMVSDKDGFIFSLTKKEIFEPVEPNKRVVSYDDYYVIFGNSELRVKCQECKLFSNFGINSGYFKARGMKVDIITNSAEREVSFKNVEIHQLEFL